MVVKTSLNDLDEILIIYKNAREFMKSHGNPTQWKDNRPSTSSIIEDINNGHHYKIMDNDKIVGVFSFYIGIDPCYNHIEGKWLNDDEYGVIHKIASTYEKKGILSECLSFVETKIKNIRIDTHKDNLVMQNALAKFEFKECGIIYVDDGTPRIAYQRTS
ncbi:MAG: GNAT family N-acetyltransferase [Acholeplasmatales bacterium]|nr:GNAT family N-acetyltransferase [Acholeplasmatales bacterium]